MGQRCTLRKQRGGLGVVAHVSNPRTWEEGAGGSPDWGQLFSQWVPGYPELHK